MSGPTLINLPKDTHSLGFFKDSWKDFHRYLSSLIVQLNCFGCFEVKFFSDSLCERSPKTVHLSQAVLNQIYLEYVTQDQTSNDLQNVTR